MSITPPVQLPTPPGPLSPVGGPQPQLPPQLPQDPAAPQGGAQQPSPPASPTIPVQGGAPQFGGKIKNGPKEDSFELSKKG